jgi:DNA-binding response OmpR family regulator
MQTRETAVRARSEDAERPKILMVDDDGDFQKILRDWLSPKYDTISLADGAEFLDEAELANPDLVILDVSLPGLDGFGLCKSLRERGRFNCVPVLFLTGFDTNEDFLRSLEAGGSAFLTKPIKRAALLTEIWRLLGR